MSLKYTNKLANQRILVLGGSSGIGFAVAQAALEHGAQVIISGSNQAKLDRALKRLEQHANDTGLPARQSGKTCNLADPEQLEDGIVALLEFATTQASGLDAARLDHVVYTAGDALHLTGLDVTVAEIHRLGMVRSTAAIILAKHLPQYMNRTARSSFSITGGTNAWRPGRNWSVVAGVCGGVEALARGLAVDLKPLRVNCANFGAIRTELYHAMFGHGLEEVIKSMAKDTLTDTVGTPEDAAEVFLYFMKNTFATGTTVNADGGRLVGSSQ